MRPLHYLEIENFKCFGDKQSIELDHPAVLIGPNNCGKTTAIQAIALWSQAVKTWWDVKRGSNAKTGTALNRLEIVAVPVQSTRYFWHNTHVRTGKKTWIRFIITLGVMYRNKVEPVTISFRNEGDELIYCTPDKDTLGRDDGLLEAAANINVGLLYPMSGLDTEEPILQPGRIDVLLGQGQTAQVLRNLCLLVHKDSKDDWDRITSLVTRLFSVDLGEPAETARGSIELHYKQHGVKNSLDVALSGRGFQQMLLIFAYLFYHKRSVLLVDEPDAHLEILRQKQVYVLLKEIAAENKSQVIMATHSEVILNEASDHNLTLIIDGQARNLAAQPQIRNTLKHFGTEHYIKARERGYVIYVEGGTDIEMLRALAQRLDHPVAREWDERINTYYTKSNFPDQDSGAELDRVEGGFGITPEKHFHGLRQTVGDLRGLAILDNDGRNRQDSEDGNLKIVYWRRYETENYFITPDVLKRYVAEQYSDMSLFSEGFSQEAEDVLFDLILERVFSGEQEDHETWRNTSHGAKRVIWEAKTAQLKLSDFAEEFFRQLAGRLGHVMLLKKGELHRLVDYVDPQHIPDEVGEKLDLLLDIFTVAKQHEETTGTE